MCGVGVFWIIGDKWGVLWWGGGRMGDMWLKK